MNLLKYHFNKKFLHNRKQPWITLTIMVIIIVAIYCYRPAYQWLSETIRHDILLSTVICTFLFFKMLSARMFYVSQIQEGHIEARGCAGSSCLLTFILAVCLTVLIIKSCKQSSDTTHHKKIPHIILKADTPK